MNKLDRFLYPILVFISGASVLIIEVVAVRVLSPYFGNTIFTYSSVLGVILAALSFGYYAGGRLADKKPKEAIFFSLFIISGFLTALFYVFGKIALPLVSSWLTIASGPLVFSVLIFFTPAFIMGMLSPFAIKLHQMKNSELGIGTTSGDIFFWSTLGSIFGSLISGYVLIPRLGLDTIFIGVSSLLFTIGVAFKLLRGSRIFPLAIILFVMVIALRIAPMIDPHYYENTLYASEGYYEHIQVVDVEYNGRPARLLLQDLNHSAAMYLNSDDLVFDYTEYYSLYRPFNEPENVLILGAGAYTLPKTYAEELPNATIDVVDIEPKLLPISKKYFRLEDQSNIFSYLEDARRFLVEKDKKYDVIYGDVYHSMMSVPAHLTTVEFYELVSDRLTDNGVFIVNIIGSLENKHPSFTLSEMRTWNEVFDNSLFFATSGNDSDMPQNIVFFASKASIDPDRITQESVEISSVQDKLIDVSHYDLDSHYLLTDNYAPVDYLTVQQFKDYRIQR